jgi:molybdenum-dependent DNA-binding transcriptional regulator ModE
MLTPEERALVTDMGDKLLDLYAKREEAISDGDLDRLYVLQAEITETSAEREEIIHSTEALQSR